MEPPDSEVRRPSPPTTTHPHRRQQTQTQLCPSVDRGLAFLEAGAGVELEDAGVLADRADFGFVEAFGFGGSSRLRVW